MVTGALPITFMILFGCSGIVYTDSCATNMKEIPVGRITHFKKNSEWEPWTPSENQEHKPHKFLSWNFAWFLPICLSQQSFSSWWWESNVPDMPRSWYFSLSTYWAMLRLSWSMISADGSSAPLLPAIQWSLTFFTKDWKRDRLRPCSLYTGAHNGMDHCMELLEFHWQNQGLKVPEDLGERCWKKLGRP